ncbi:MAG: glutamate formimidoyltransferase [Candidatus Aminicenantes bacterium]|nr:glutamate formimidoyltransferase [Candidatus Aminicenantes bacterium]
MNKIISCVPNVCEGKDQKFIDGLVEKLKAVNGLIVLDVSRDSVRNRTVFSFTGPQEAIFDAGLMLYRESLAHIDMREHQGEYPRIGALDVFPFVPLKDASLEETVAMSVAFAQKVAEEFNIPVFLYGESARFPRRRYIENIREGEYEGLEQKLRDPRWKPDFGPAVFNPTSGATVVGARYPMISFKAILNTSDEAIAEYLSRIIQHASGGLAHITANPGMDSEHKVAQITVTISNYRAMPMYRVLEMLRAEARRFAVAVSKVEMIGLIPEIAFIESAFYYLGIQDFSFDKILERKIQTQLDEKIQPS